MKIVSLICDICHKEFPYPEGYVLHKHSELELDGVPVNIWSYKSSFTPLSRTSLSVENESGIKRFYKYLPLDKNEIYSKGEGDTQLLNINFNNMYKYKLFLKDESTNPTGSFKDRGTSLLLADAVKSHKKYIAIPSTGNAAISLGAYAPLYGFRPIVFVPITTSSQKKKMIERFAEVIYDKDIIESWNHFFRYCKKRHDVYNAFPTTNILYQQGLKTMSYEIYLQLNGVIPDWIVIPCGSGGNFVSQYQAFSDLYQLGLASKIPKFVSVQIRGADPLTIASKKFPKNELVVIQNQISSKAEGIASDVCFNQFKICNIIKITRGYAISVSDEQIDAVKNFDNLEYSSRAVFAALPELEKYIRENDVVVVIGTASSIKEK